VKYPLSEYRYAQYYENVFLKKAKSAILGKREYLLIPLFSSGTSPNSDLNICISIIFIKYLSDLHLWQQENSGQIGALF